MEFVKNDGLKKMVYSALGIALVTLATLVIRIPTANGGYINFGDIMIFAVATTLGKKYGFIAGAFGSAIADLIAGAPIYILGTFIIKGIEGFLCGQIFMKKEESKTFVLPVATVISGVWMALGYLTYETIIFGGAAAIVNISGNLLQGLVSAAAAVPLIIAIRKNKSILNLSR